MVNSEVLLTDLKKLLGQLEGDLRERADDVPTLGESLRSAYQRAKQAERTAQSFETWREEYPNSVALLSSRARALTTLRQINSQMNPFRFIVYSEWSGKALAPVSPQ